MKTIKSKEFIKAVKGSDRIFKDGFKQIAFIGRSNVGKSSLINSLTGSKNLAKFSSKPGKTISLNFYLINQKIYFVDLPGYGYSKAKIKERDKLWKMIDWYIRKSNLEISGKQAFVLIIDSAIGFTDFDLEILEMLKSLKKNYFIILNKSDKTNQKQKSEIIKIAERLKIKKENYFLFSNKDKKKIEFLIDKVLSL